ncbi:hypothetical protein ACP70R_004149 [Stipagrostis hirtigluma subsp. patula]
MSHARKRGRKDKGAAMAPLEVGCDRLSALPDDALQHILSFLPAQDAVQTCVLARRWRDMWKFTKGLHITTSGSVEEIRDFVDHLLLIRAGSPIDTFEIRTCEGMSKDDISRVNLWIRHVVACKVQLLQIKIFGGTWLKLKDVHLVFVSQHLTRLELAYVRLKDSFLNFTSCPALQDLRINKRCELMNVKRISSQSLKHLSIEDCNSNRGFRTRIQAPNLVSLRLDEAFERAPVLERMPLLVEAVVTIHICCADRCSHTACGSCDDLSCHGCYGIEEEDTSCVLLQGLSTVKNLTLIAWRDLKWCPTFRQLKNLLLNEYWCVPDVSALACILQHSSILEKLTLQLFSKGPKHKVEINGSPNPKQISAAISEHLKIVQVKCEVVDEKVLSVLKFLSKLNIRFSFE